jgi:DNA repair protein RadD
VSVLTTGFDAPHVDLIAILRATESAGLLQQIIGRGLRVSPGKDDCLVLDYAENLDRHFPDGRDIFDPKIEVGPPIAEPMLICECPTCGKQNEFRARPNPAGFEIDMEGYFTDLDGYRIPVDPDDEDSGAMPAHYGRRCQTRHIKKLDAYRCDYRWTSKDCPHCGAENDIAARRCEECKGEIVDPNTKLRLAYRAFKKDPTRTQCDEVTGWLVREHVSKSGNDVYRIDVTTPYRSFAFWIMKRPANGYQAAALQRFLLLHGEKPDTITYYRNKDNDFYNVTAYNRPADEDPGGNPTFWQS